MDVSDSVSLQSLAKDLWHVSPTEKSLPDIRPGHRCVVSPLQSGSIPGGEGAARYVRGIPSSFSDRYGIIWYMVFRLSKIFKKILNIRTLKIHALQCDYCDNSETRFERGVSKKSKKCIIMFKPSINAGFQWQSNMNEQTEYRYLKTLRSNCMYFQRFLQQMPPLRVHRPSLFRGEGESALPHLPQTLGLPRPLPTLGAWVPLQCPGIPGTAVRL